MSGLDWLRSEWSLNIHVLNENLCDSASALLDGTSQRIQSALLLERYQSHFSA